MQAEGRNRWNGLQNSTLPLNSKRKATMKLNNLLTLGAVLFLIASLHFCVDGSNVYEFVDTPDMKPSEVKIVMDWIRKRVTSAGLPVCWPDSYSRGIGEVPGREAECPTSFARNGTMCKREAHE